LKTPDLEGATPVDSAQEEGLIPTHITTRGELNAWEQRNILKAEAWLLETRRNPLSVSFTRELHKRMFDDTWEWAGKHRQSDTTIGSPWYEIPAKLTELIGDAEYWLRQTTYSIDEAAARLHHRLTSIHPFPNGNGRHARLMADVLLQRNGRERFAWGSDLEKKGAARDAYILALRAADQNNYQKLFTFLKLAQRP
jgi:Fic-DOC domain mobile mystery protein B